MGRGRAAPPSPQEARAKLRAAQRELDQGVRADSRTTVGKWLDFWLETVVAGRVGSNNTRASYRTIVRAHLKPGLGEVRLSDLTAEQVDMFLRQKAEAGFGRSHVGRMRTILADALRHAERRGLIARNAASLAVMPPTKNPAQRQSLTPADVKALLSAADGERLGAAVAIGLSVGLRPGELLGIQWADLDLDGSPPTLTVSRSLKRVPRLDSPGYDVALGPVKRSMAGQRTVAVPTKAVAALKAHKARQAAERLKAGDLWQDHGLVFTNEVGGPVDPCHLRRVFARIAKRAGLDVTFPYVLRHTAVSLALDAGASIEQVADMTGDDPRTLYRYYRHKVRPVAEAGLLMEQVLGTSETR